MSTANIEKYAPLISLFGFLKAIKLQRIDDTFILWASDFISKMNMVSTIYSIGLILLYITAFGIFKEDSWRPILKWTF
jgi:hypothetical protein